MKKTIYFLVMFVLITFAPVLLAGCGDREETAAQFDARTFQTPEGRILTANQRANMISVIDVATNRTYAQVITGEQPHHVVATPDGKEFWVSLYGEHHVQVFNAQTLQLLDTLDAGGNNDDLVFDPEGKRLYVTLGASNAVSIMDVAERKLLGTIRVGRTPHGLRVTPDGRYLLVTNTAENTLSLVEIGADAAETKVVETIKTGANPFEVVVSADSGTAYVSNFLGDSIGIIDIPARKTVGYIRSGKRPAMLALQENPAQNTEGSSTPTGGPLIWVANTGSGDAWLIDPSTRKMVSRIPVGRGAHGTVITPGGIVYITNTEDSTVSAIDPKTGTVAATIPVGNFPNGLTFLPNVVER